VQEQAAAAQRLGQLAARVRGEHDERAAGRGDRAQLGDGDLEVAEHLQEQALHLDVRLVGLVDQQDLRLVAADGGQQRAGEQELLAEDVRARLVPRLVVARADAQQLFGVVPLVQGPGLVDALVALQTHQPCLSDLRHGLGELGLADSGRPFHKERLAQAVGEEDGRGDRGRREVTGLGETRGDVVDGCEQGGLPLGGAAW
jgi:hypothetical protein